MDNAKINEQAANHLRKAIKELRWAAYNLEQYYNAVKPEEAPVITKPGNQLEMFSYGQEEEG